MVGVVATTIALDGPLTKPKIVPQPGSAVLRIGAALATGGFSVLGENEHDGPIRSAEHAVERFFIGTI